MSTSTPRRFYFQIRSANVIEAIMAHTITEAQQIAARDGWLPYWAEMEWLNPEPATHE
jgi:hypothetical protein